MAKIKISRGMEAEVDDEMYGFLSQFRWYALSGRNTFYAQMFIPNNRGTKSSVLMHHLVQGRPLEPFVSEHKNGNGLDNRKSNLTFLNRRDNSKNTFQKRMGISTSRFPGVHKQGKKYRSMILSNGSHIYLGKFDSEEEAAEAYKSAELELLLP